MKNFGSFVKVGFESQHLKRLTPSVTRFVCKEFGIIDVRFIWLGVNIEVMLWLETP